MSTGAERPVDLGRIYSARIGALIFKLTRSNHDLFVMPGGYGGGVGPQGPA